MFAVMSNTRLSGEPPSCLSQWSRMQLLDMSGSRFQRVPLSLFAMSSVANINLADNQLAFDPLACPMGSATIRSLDLSGNPWNVDVGEAMQCLTGTIYNHTGNDTTQLAHLALNRMGLTGWPRTTCEPRLTWVRTACRAPP